MGLSILNFIFNVCRTPLDVLHILSYLFIVFIASAVALYRFDKNLFIKYVSRPYLHLLVRLNFIKTTIVRRRSLKIIKYNWTPLSNRSPYVTKILRYTLHKLFR